jgi:hypothetical protein
MKAANDNYEVSLFVGTIQLEYRMFNNVPYKTGCRYISPEGDYFEIVHSRRAQELFTQLE